MQRLQEVANRRRQSFGSVSPKSCTAALGLFVLASVSVGSTAIAQNRELQKPPSDKVLRVAPPASCESMANLKLRDTVITTAQSVPAGSFSPPSGATLTGLPDFCRVAGVIYPAIRFEVWLPAFTWNWKFLMVGGGGTQGSLGYSAVAAALQRGYASATTDTGHSSADATFSWMTLPGTFNDWAFRGTHETAVKAKAVIASYFGDGPRRAYFQGCSGGGQQAMTEVQRTNDFDGVIAGAPAFNWGPLMAGELSNNIALRKTDPAGVFPTAKLTLVNNAALDACDAADGLKDGVIQDPRTCNFDPTVLLCTAADAADCLTAPQVAAVKRTYQGAMNPRTGEQIYPGLMPGGEPLWTPLNSGSVPFGSNYAYYRFGVFEDPNWDYTTFDFDADYAYARGKLGTLDSSFDPDLRDFRDRGAKLIMYHGWSDYFLAPMNTVTYYGNVVDGIAADMKNGGDAVQETQKFARLFMVPGMGHCSGGPGTDQFDFLNALEQWVERGIAPDRIIASHRTSGVVDKTRPLCPHPQVARYSGTGDVSLASSFVCAAGPL